MRKNKLIRTIITVVVLITVVVVLVQHFHIRYFHTVEPEVLYTSGQPRGMDYPRLLYRYHIATIVNVRMAPEHRERNWRSEEIVWARSNAVRYIEMPIDRDKYFPDQQTQQQFLAIMADKDNLSVLVHGSGDDRRVAMLVAVWLRRGQGQTSEQTIGVIEKIIDGGLLTQEEVKFINGLTQQVSQ